MQIAHEEAHKLIHISMDKTLKPQEKNTLQAHLEACIECRAVAEELKEVENLLLPAMLRHWDLQPIPLSIDAITKKRKSQLHASIILTTRTAIISIVLAAFVFSAWQFTQAGEQTSNPLPVGVLPVPTPSSQSTSTRISFRNCEKRTYQVQKDDTLDSIARQFSISKDRIMTINNVNTETLKTEMELLIPICDSTPTSTAHPSTLTITFTPLIAPTDSTPSG
jgi:hypothetical protein